MAKKPSLAEADALRAKTEEANGAKNPPRRQAPDSALGSAKSKRAPSRRGKTSVYTFVTADTLKRLKYLAIDENTSQQALLGEALEKLLRERGH